MAQTQKNAAQLWAESAARAKFALHNGLPLMGISGDTGDGHIVPLPAPSWFHLIEDQGQRDNVFRAFYQHATRVGQGKLKAADKPTREHAAAGVASVIDGTYSPGRESDNDILDTAVYRRVERRVREAKPDATDNDVAATLKDLQSKDDGKAWLAKQRAAVLESSSYIVNRKGDSKAKPAAVSFSLTE